MQAAIIRHVGYGPVEPTDAHNRGPRYTEERVNTMVKAAKSLAAKA